MSVGNLKDQGNKGNNFPFQVKNLQLLSLSQLQNLEEVTITGTSNTILASNITAYFVANPDKYLVSKSVVHVASENKFIAMLSIAEI